MQDKQSSIINYIKSQLKADFKVGEYPFDVEKHALGDWTDVALVQDGNEEILEGEQNKYVNKFYRVSVWYYSNNQKHRIGNLLEKQALIEDKLLDDPTVDGNADCIEIMSVEKGDELPMFTGYTPGYYGNHSCRKLNFNVKIRQVR